MDHQAEMRGVMKQMVTYLAAGKEGSGDVSEKHLRNIDLSKLKELFVSDNQIKTIRGIDFSELIYCRFDNNKLTNCLFSNE